MTYQDVCSRSTMDEAPVTGSIIAQQAGEIFQPLKTLAALGDPSSVPSTHTL